MPYEYRVQEHSSMGVAGIFFRGGGDTSKILKIFLKKIAKNALFYHIFKKFNKPCVTFLRVWTKNANCWEIEKILMKIL